MADKKDTPQKKEGRLNSVCGTLTKEDMARFNAAIPWGARGEVISVLVMQLTTWIENNPDKRTIVLGAIVSGDLRAEHILKLDKDARETDNS